MQALQLLGPIAIVDVETTGLFPFRHDRIIEIAAVVMDGEGQIVREFASLVNPNRDVGPTRIHGLTTEDVIHAPQFGEIAGLLVEALRGTVAIAGHNVRFDQQFIKSEFDRINVAFPQCETLCTLQMAGGGKLSACCADYGIPLDGEAHHALADARATARLLSVLLTDLPQIVQRLKTRLPIQWPAFAVSGTQPITRDESRRRQGEPPRFLKRLLERVHANTEHYATDGAIMAYAALIDRALEDRNVDDAEADALVESAFRWGLNREQIRFVHDDYINKLAIAAVADG